MTTKKQRREQVAAKAERRRQTDIQLGLMAQQREKEKRDRVMYDADRAEQKKAAALRLRKAREASIPYENRVGTAARIVRLMDATLESSRSI